MRDKPIIFAGLFVGLVVLAVPFWYPLATGSSGPPPDLEKPTGYTKCVEDREFMRARHMDILEEWREEVVREGDCGQVEIDGQKFDKSLSNGCMKCHTNRETFCLKCHEYANVVPFRPLQESKTCQSNPRGLRCWDCHVVPEEVQAEPEPEKAKAEPNSVEKPAEPEPVEKQVQPESEEKKSEPSDG